jgi:hypothetical protein
LPTMMEEGNKKDGDKVTIPWLEATCKEAPESSTQSKVLGGRVRLTVLKAAARELVSHGAATWGGAW